MDPPADDYKLLDTPPGVNKGVAGVSFAGNGEKVRNKWYKAEWSDRDTYKFTLRSSCHTFTTKAIRYSVIMKWFRRVQDKNHVWWGGGPNRNQYDPMGKVHDESPAHDEEFNQKILPRRNIRWTLFGDGRQNKEERKQRLPYIVFTIFQMWHAKFHSMEEYTEFIRDFSPSPEDSVELSKFMFSKA